MKAIDKAIELVGLSALSTALGESPQTISNWRTRGVPEKQCPNVERVTNGAVPCERLRSDVKWVRVLDPTWPHPDGRPLVDHTAQKAA